MAGVDVSGILLELGSQPSGGRCPGGGVGQFSQARLEEAAQQRRAGRCVGQV